MCEVRSVHTEIETYKQILNRLDSDYHIAA